MKKRRRGENIEDLLLQILDELKSINKKLDAVTPSLNASDIIDRLDSAMNDMIPKLAE